MLLLFEQIFINLAWYNGIAKIFFFFFSNLELGVVS